MRVLSWDSDGNRWQLDRGQPVATRRVASRGNQSRAWARPAVACRGGRIRVALGAGTGQNPRHALAQDLTARRRSPHPPGRCRCHRRRAVSGSQRVSWRYRASRAAKDRSPPADRRQARSEVVSVPRDLDLRRPGRQCARIRAGALRPRAPGQCRSQVAADSAQAPRGQSCVHRWTGRQPREPVRNRQQLERPHLIERQREPGEWWGWRPADVHRGRRGQPGIAVLSRRIQEDGDVDIESALAHRPRGRSRARRRGPRVRLRQRRIKARCSPCPVGSGTSGRRTAGCAA